MTINTNIDEKLLKDVVAAGHHSSNDAAISAALEAYLRGLRRRQLAEVIGTIDFDPDWDPRVIRGKSPCKKS